MVTAFPHQEEQRACSQHCVTALKVNMQKILLVSFRSQSEID